LFVEAWGRKLDVKYFMKISLGNLPAKVVRSDMNVVVSQLPHGMKLWSSCEGILLFWTSLSCYPCFAPFLRKKSFAPQKRPSTDFKRTTIA